VVRSIPIKPRAVAAFASLMVAAVTLSGCDRDTSAAKQLAAANAAAERAEKAALRAEVALEKIEKANQPQVIEVDPNATEDAEDAAVAEQNEPADPAADVKS